MGGVRGRARMGGPGGARVYGDRIGYRVLDTLRVPSLYQLR